MTSELDSLTGVGECRLVAGMITRVGFSFVVGAVLGVGGVILVGSDDNKDPELPAANLAAPDTAPAEFAYLDSGRVLAYLGQIEGGLAAAQTRTSSAKTTTKASLTAKDLAAAEASSEKLRGSSETVTYTEADRFYTLLRILREDQAAKGERAFKTLVNIDARITEGNPFDRILKQVKGVEEGDFVRIRHAHLFIPPYAAILRRARFASSYLGGGLKEPKRALYAPVSAKARRVVAHYRSTLPSDPRVPMVVPTLGSKPSAPTAGVVTFFVPARYRSLSREASLLGGELTIVGKVVYVDTGDSDEGAEPATYLDRETLATFAPALQKAAGSLLSRLQLGRDRIVKQVNESLTMRAPVVVVIPVAIYQ